MTVRIKREAILQVLDGARQPPPTSSYQSASSAAFPQASEEDGGFVVYAPKHDAAVVVPSFSSREDSFFGQFLSMKNQTVESLLQPTVNLFDSLLPDLDDTDDDCTTVSSCSSRTDSLAIDPSTRRVSFSSPLVTEIKTRPRTSPEDLRLLYYTYEETQRFRQEYRLERKALANIDDGATSVVPEEGQVRKTLSSWHLSHPWSTRHRISRVVVVHQDTFKTFYDKGLKPRPKTHPISDHASIASDDFFDNDSFWSGSLTWY